MADQRGFRNDGTEPTRTRKSNYGDDHMKKKGEDIAHAGMVSNLKSPAIQGNWGIRHVQANRNLEQFDVSGPFDFTEELRPLEEWLLWMEWKE
jgi:hypothetical protein